MTAVLVSVTGPAALALPAGDPVRQLIAARLLSTGSRRRKARGNR
jgi:hypothetical protein